MKKRKWLGTVIYLAILVLGFAWLMGLFDGRDDQMSYTQVAQLFRQEQVKSGVLDGDHLKLQLHTPLKNGRVDVSTALSDPEGFRNELGGLILEQTDKGIIESFDYIPVEGFSGFDLVLPFLLVGVILLSVMLPLMDIMSTIG